MKKFVLFISVLAILFSLSALANAAPEITGEGDLRVREPVGLRVKAEISADTAIADSTSEYGFLVTRKVFLTAKDMSEEIFSLDCDFPYTKGIAKGKVNGEDVDIFFDRNDESVFFSCYIHGIAEPFYTDEIVIRPYIISDGTTSYGQPVTTSIYDTAKSIYYDNERFDWLSDEYQRKIFSMVASVENLRENAVEFVVDGNTYDVQTVFSKKFAKAPSEPRKEGYSFSHWSLEENGDRAEVSETEICEDTTFYAVFERISYQVTFIADGEEFEEKEIFHGDFCFAPSPDPTLEGHSFIGWSETEDGEVTDITKLKITEPEVFYAVFERLSYNVTFIADGKEFEEKEIFHGDFCLAPSLAPTLEGHSFVGWSETEDGEVTDVTKLKITKPEVFYAVFERLSYNVTFIADGKEFEEKEIFHGDFCLAPSLAPTLEGHSFVGWSETEDGEVTDVTKLKITKPEVFYAVFERLYYKVIFMVDGEVFDVQDILYGECPRVPESPVREGYVFAGWAQEPTEDTSKVVDASEMVICKETDFYAVIFKNPNEQVFMDNLALGKEQLLGIPRLSGATKEAIVTMAECIGYVLEDAKSGIHTTKDYVKEHEVYGGMVEYVKDLAGKNESVRKALISILTDEKNISPAVRDFLCEYFDINIEQIK